MTDIPTPIRDVDLRHSDLPGGDAGFEELSRFALTLDGLRDVTRIAPRANRCREQWEKTGQLPMDLRELRECLFFEQRRQRHFATGPGGDAHPTPQAVGYMRALVEGIRRAVEEPPSSGGSS